jgi:RNA polymerase sigma factor (sigma-70 family)
VMADNFVHQPRQEEESLLEERQQMIDEIVDALTERERNLFELLCLGTPAKEIARLMNIKPDSVHRGKHALIKKLQRLIGPLM